METIGVFGAYTRGEETQKSDIDILLTFNKENYTGLFEFMDLEEFLAKSLGVKVDGIKECSQANIGKHILEEVVMV